MGNEEVMRISRKRGYLYPSFEIYSGVAGFYDYGPLGGVLKNNIMNLESIGWKVIVIWECELKECFDYRMESLLEEIKNDE